jgi:hypothetical protein
MEQFSRWIIWNYLGFDINFSCQENLAFQRAKKVFYVVRFLRHLIDYIYRKHLSFEYNAAFISFVVAMLTLIINCRE